jgi:hypothetical protein
MAITIDYLFGSSRGITSISIDGTNYIQKEQDIYSGTMMKLFFHSKRLKYKDYGMGFYLSLKNALKPLSVNRISHQPFEDNNESGNHDGSYYSDFPDLSLIPDAIQSNSIGEIDPFRKNVESWTDIPLSALWMVLDTMLAELPRLITTAVFPLEPVMVLLLMFANAP